MVKWYVKINRTHHQSLNGRIQRSIKTGQYNFWIPICHLGEGRVACCMSVQQVVASMHLAFSRNRPFSMELPKLVNGRRSWRSFSANHQARSKTLAKLGLKALDWLIDCWPDVEKSKFLAQPGCNESTTLSKKKNLQNLRKKMAKERIEQLR